MLARLAGLDRARELALSGASLRRLGGRRGVHVVVAELGAVHIARVEAELAGELVGHGVGAVDGVEALALLDGAAARRGGVELGRELGGGHLGR